MTSFISLEPEAVMAASGMTAGLAGEAAGHGGQVAASAAAVPPGIEEISVANAAKIAEFASQASAVLEAGAAFQAEHGVAVGISSAVTDLADAINYAAIGQII
ncbi:PE domain-containing protein [Mycolicibacterium sphagni]|uniref:PE domain-containing protein n=1 Tax=Mycolicibacterium sphagni TaxID=1786 RepID=A0ABX2K4B1_9MYCO|nr:PE domain-containing protein [Mycolicibacterium sphagni]NTY62555.1 PE domain-containing protein [Mycolicibacterium sphagni]